MEEINRRTKQSFWLIENEQKGLAYHSGQTSVTAHSSHEDAIGICQVW